MAWQKPANWGEIVAFAKRHDSTGDAEKQIAVRPSLEHSRATLQDLLTRVQLRNCRTNPGYIQALGLKVPPS